MVAKRHERTRARRAALEVLYSSELTGKSPSFILEEGIDLKDKDESALLSNYAERVICGVESHQSGIARYLDDASRSWPTDRMPVVDRCLLRLALYEMLYVDEVPVSVAINEAVELAREFGGNEESPRFVNGVLGEIARRMEDEKAQGLVPGAPVASAEPASETADSDEQAQPECPEPLVSAPEDANDAEDAQEPADE